MYITEIFNHRYKEGEVVSLNEFIRKIPKTTTVSIVETVVQNQPEAITQLARVYW